MQLEKKQDKNESLVRETESKRAVSVPGIHPQGWVTLAWIHPVKQMYPHLSNEHSQSKLGKSKGILNPQGFARVSTKGKGKGQLYSTLAKPLPLPRVEGYWKGTARVLIHKYI